MQAMETNCIAFLNRVETEHDRLHGPGTGDSFLRGPYAKDLPRALSARIKPEIERQTAEAARAEQARKNQEAEVSAARTKVIREVVDAHFEFVRNAAADFVILTTEGAEAITTAAMAKCSQYEEKRVTDATAAFGVARNLVSRLLQMPLARCASTSSARSCRRAPNWQKRKCRSRNLKAQCSRAPYPPRKSTSP